MTVLPARIAPYRAALLAALVLFPITGVSQQQHSPADGYHELFPETPPLPLPAKLSDRLREHVDSLAHAGGHRSRVVFTEGNEYAVDYVLRQMRRIVPDAYADTFRVERRGMRESYPLVNPTAILPGRSDTVLVICAHIDASASRDGGWSGNWSRMRAPGADDNATGVAALLEALVLAAHAPSKPRYTLMFVATNAEEKNPDYAGAARRDGHHLGSLHVARRLKSERTPVHGVIVMDMVGWNPRETYVGLFAAPRAQWLARELATLRDRMGLRLNLPSSYASCRNSDNEAFDRLGIPAVLFMESCRPWRNEGRAPRNPNYHSGRDLPAAVNYDVLLRVTKLVAGYMIDD